MEVEMNLSKPGWIEVICGPMFSGKTEGLIRRVRRAIISKQEIILFKPSVDNRYHETDVVSHDANALTATTLEKVTDIHQYLSFQTVIAFDEAQFFDPKIVDITKELANKGKRVIIAGLDKDSFARPFGSMHELMCVAEYVTKLHAICSICGSTASFTFRKRNSKELVLLGEKDIYEPRCRHCYYAANYNIF